MLKFAHLRVGALALAVGAGLVFGNTQHVDAASQGPAGSALMCQADVYGSNNYIKFDSPRIYALEGWGVSRERVIIEAHLWVLDPAHNRWLDAGTFSGQYTSSGPYALDVDQYSGGNVFAWSTWFPGVGPLPHGYTYTVGFKIWWMNGATYTYGQYSWGSCRF